jgi:hypothetical protein
MHKLNLTTWSLLGDSHDPAVLRSCQSVLPQTVLLHWALTTHPQLAVVAQMLGYNSDAWQAVHDRQQNHIPRTTAIILSPKGELHDNCAVDPMSGNTVRH